MAAHSWRGGLCKFCEKPVVTESQMAMLVEGWVEWRRGGGSHGIRLQSSPKAIAHQTCLEMEIDRLRRGGQQALL